MKKGILALALVFSSVVGLTQMHSPVQWSYAAKKTSDKDIVLLIKAKLQPGWHIYSLNLKEFPAKTRFTFSPSKEYTLIGSPLEPKPISKYDKILKLNLTYFENDVVFAQKIRLQRKTKAVVKGTVTFVACNDKGCLPTAEQAFSIPIK